MARVRRVTALVLTILLVEPLLAGVGYACSMPDSMANNERRSPGEVTTVVATASSPATTADEDCPDAMPTSTQRTGGPGKDVPPCPLPWAPLGCRGAPCSPATLASAPPAATSTEPTPADQPSLAVLALLSVVRAPELPPPRA